jgi:hypothetical protein
MNKFLLLVIVLFLIGCTPEETLDLEINDFQLSWNEISNTDKYKILIGSNEIRVSETFVDLINYNELLQLGNNNITVTAIIGDAESTSSEIIFHADLKPPRTVYISSDGKSNVLLEWEKSIGADSYIVMIDDYFEEIIAENKLLIHYSSFADLTTTNIRVSTLDINGEQSKYNNNIQLKVDLGAPTISAIYQSGNPRNMSGLEWSRISNALHYTINVGNDSVIFYESSFNIRDFVRANNLELKNGMTTFSVTSNILGFSSKPSNVVSEFIGIDLTFPERQFRYCFDSCNVEILFNIIGVSDEVFFPNIGIEFEYTVITNNPTNLSSLRVMARLLDKLGNPATLPSPPGRTHFDISLLSSARRQQAIFPFEIGENKTLTSKHFIFQVPFGNYELEFLESPYCSVCGSIRTP